MQLVEPLPCAKRRKNALHTIFERALYQRHLYRSHLAKQRIPQRSWWKVFVPAKFRTLDPSQDKERVLDRVVKSQAAPMASRSPAETFRLECLESCPFRAERTDYFVRTASAYVKWHTNG